MLVTNNLHRPLEIELVIPVRTYDIDFVGIVSNIVYIRWLEDLRLKFLDEHWQLGQQLEQGYAPILAGTQIEYKQPIKLNDKVIGRLWLSKLGQLKWTVQAEILSNNKLAAIAIQKGAFVSLENGRPVPIPMKMQNKYAESQQVI
ncbi:putative thioesterase [Cylindrospermum stagnale PCC 7417]|uniref:Putative thioesterase n=1 Tax=Cylindrospermum stagnale PCC 7417 TaxID=56107 RepID=K9X420_9NOST|nr:thioesterase family protein [Cylindrospermum stagnale]AFZ26806.1 putative thioesterase [Cylindrospermum stagnale PCC 7417]